MIDDDPATCDAPHIRLFTIAEVDCFRAQVAHGDVLDAAIIERLCIQNAFLQGKLRGQAALYELYSVAAEENTKLRAEIEHEISERIDAQAANIRLRADLAAAKAATDNWEEAWRVTTEAGHRVAAERDVALAVLAQTEQERDRLKQERDQLEKLRADLIEAQTEIMDLTRLLGGVR